MRTGHKYDFSNHICSAEFLTFFEPNLVLWHILLIIYCFVRRLDCCVQGHSHWMPVLFVLCQWPLCTQARCGDACTITDNQTKHKPRGHVLIIVHEAPNRGIFWPAEWHSFFSSFFFSIPLKTSLAGTFTGLPTQQAICLATECSQCLKQMTVFTVLFSCWGGGGD